MKRFSQCLWLVLSCVMLEASSKIDDKVIAFEKERFLVNQRLVLKEVLIHKKEPLPLKGWYGYVLNLTADVPGRGLVRGNDMLFSNGQAVATELIDMKNGSSFKDLLLPKVDASYYTKEHLIAGNEKAKNKVVVFSDPLCPACQQTLPSMIQKVNANANDIALYYYHFPLLSIHPAALTVSEAMVVAKKRGFKDLEMKLYLTDFSSHFNAREQDRKKILDGFNTLFKTNITLKDLDDAQVKKEVQNDMHMGEKVMVQGTPTIFVNGQNDKTRRLFSALGQKK